MPRQARLDAPGVLQHVMARGIERRKIFWDDKDRKVPEVGDRESEVRSRKSEIGCRMSDVRWGSYGNGTDQFCERFKSL